MIRKTSKLVSAMLSLCLVLGSIVFFTPETYAATSVSSAKKAYTKALNNEAKAKLHIPMRKKHTIQHQLSIRKDPEDSISGS